MAGRTLIPKWCDRLVGRRRWTRVRIAPVADAIFVAVGLVLAGTGLWPTMAEAGGSLRLTGVELGAIEATTFDGTGRPIGRSSFEVVPSGPGRITMKIEISVEAGGVNRSMAVLEEAPSFRPVPDSGAMGVRELRLVEQRSHAIRADGQSLDLLVIDHEGGRASCYAAADIALQNDRHLDKEGQLEHGRHLELPEDERVVNVPMQLLFQPLVEREVESIRFQIALCRGEPVLHDMIAVRGPVQQQDGRRIVEIRYGPDLGRTVSWLASRLLPRLSFWLDEEAGAYLAHRMPLHTGGPEVLLVRSGIEPADLGVR